MKLSRKILVMYAMIESATERRFYRLYSFPPSMDAPGIYPAQITLRYH